MLIATVLAAWVQYAADGKPHARAVAPLTCPALSYDGGSSAMRQRAAAARGFTDVVCDAAIPSGAANLNVEGTRLPQPVRAPRTIVVIGDTGCRMKDQEQQNCGDIYDWPFPKITQTIAAVHADLVVHVGDYYYRENNCPAVMTKCENRWGDTSISWNADWLSPGKPLFAAAPLVLTRGNHEDCNRGGAGWYRYLDPGDATKTCAAGTVDGSMPWAATFDGLRIVVGDSAGDPSDTASDATRIGYYTTAFRAAQSLAAEAHGETWFVTHRPPYANANETQAILGMKWNFAPFGVVLSGHIHDFETIDLAGYAPMIINGESGDDMDDAGTAAAAIRDLKAYTFATPPPFGTKQFGFAVYTRNANRWTISLRDVDGIERRACSLTKGSAGC
jgi:Calcineurin-like phosphoesterase